MCIRFHGIVLSWSSSSVFTVAIVLYFTRRYRILFIYHDTRSKILIKTWTDLINGDIFALFHYSFVCLYFLSKYINSNSEHEKYCFPCNNLLLILFMFCFNFLFEFKTFYWVISSEYSASWSIYHDAADVYIQLASKHCAVLIKSDTSMSYYTFVKFRKFAKQSANKFKSVSSTMH